MRTKKQKGFTLTEMIVVIAIIAILAAILIPTVTKYIKNAKFTSDSSDADTMTTELTAYCSDNGASIDAAKLHGTEVRTILLNLDFSLVPRSKEWTFVYRDSTNKVEAIYLEDLEKETAANVPAATAYVDPSQVSTDLYLLGLGESDLEVAVTALVNCASIEKYNALGDSATGYFKSGSKYNALYNAFAPAKTMYISNGSALTGAGTGDTITKFVYADTTTHISALSSAAKKALGTEKIPLSATIRSVESAAVAYVKQYAGVTYRTISGDDPSVQKLDDQVEQNYKTSAAFSQYVTYYTISASELTTKAQYESTSNIVYIKETKTENTKSIDYYTVAKEKYNSEHHYYILTATKVTITSAQFVFGTHFEVCGASYQFGDLVEQSTSQQVSYQVVGYVGTSSSIAKGVTTESATAITSDGAYYIVKKAPSTLAQSDFVDTYEKATAFVSNTSYVTFSQVSSSTEADFGSYFILDSAKYVKATGTYSSSVTYYKMTGQEIKPNVDFSGSTSYYYLTSSTYYTKKGNQYSLADSYVSGDYYTLERIDGIYTDSACTTKATINTTGTYYYADKYTYVKPADIVSTATYYYIDETHMVSTTGIATGTSDKDYYILTSGSIVFDGTNNALAKETGKLVESKVTITAWVYRVTISYYNATGLYARTKYEIVQEQTPAQVLTKARLDGLLGSE